MRLLLLLGALVFAVDPEVPATPYPPTVTIERGDNQIVAIKYGPDEAGLSIDCLPSDDDPNKITRSVFYDVSPYLVHVTVDKNVIRAPVVIAEKKERGDGELEAFNGTATRRAEDDSECLPIIKKDLKPNSVFVTQGKTKLSGSRLKYSEETGIATIDGPITFERPQSGNSVLRGTSEKITVDVDNEQTFLEGNVKLESRCRSSSASKVEYDDRENRAILYGNPAVSKRLDGSDEIKAERIEYNLETNDVTLEGSISGVIDDAAKPCNESGN
jgi:lipopolysaccharide export system protein LptA